MEQKIQQKIQLILPVLLRTIGPILLRSGIGGGGGGGGTSTSTSNDDDDEDDNGTVSGDSKTRKTNNGGKVSISLPTFPPDDDEDEDEDEDENDVVKASTTAATIASTASTAPVTKATTTATTTTTEAPVTTTASSSTRTTRQAIELTTAIINQIDSTTLDIGGRIDIRIQEDEVDSLSNNNDNSSSIRDVIGTIFSTNNDTIATETPSSTADEVTTDSIINSPPQGLIHQSADESNQIPNGVYLPTATSNDSNLVRRRKAIQN